MERNPDRQRSPRPVADVDLSGIAEALDDHSGDTSWWYDPTSGQVEMHLPDSYLSDADDEVDPSARGLIPIESAGSRDAYRAMTAFAEAVSEPRAADLLQRSLEGRGAFRRFRDTVHEFPDLSEQWFVYREAANSHRAIDWLLDQQLVDHDDAEAEASALTSTMEAALDEVRATGDAAFDECAVVEQWSAIRDLVEDGHAVTIRRDGHPWATISRHPHVPS